MKTEELSRSEIVAIIGGVLLAIGLFLPWYHIAGPNNSINGHNSGDLSGWQVHTTARWLLLAAAAAPLILAWIIIRGHALSWPRGEMTAVSSVAAAGLIIYMAFINRPGTTTALTHYRYGVFVALFGSLLMLAGSALRASLTERPRKPPGVI